MKDEIKWYTSLMEIKDISKRERIAKDDEIVEYAVVKIVTVDSFDTFRPWQHIRRLKRKEVTLMCFSKRIYDNLKIGAYYRFDGTLSFGWGNTYLVIKEAADVRAIEFTEIEKEDQVA